jgi:hypothetical protein
MCEGRERVIAEKKKFNLEFFHVLEFFLYFEIKTGFVGSLNNFFFVN